ncbi:MAG: right-handed parallel beta-helix repeat-containing protein [Aquabacterium sp.]|nr:MAG: right-handed parallel beta-helix repeat-containing protein [Aquabacterium sp.]
MVAGTATAPYPTIENISLLWPYSGDADGDSRASVRFRRAGDSAWTTGMPLRRVPAGSTNEGLGWSARHAGSLFNLQAATTYQVELTLSDPDGGSATQTLSVTTRAVPAPPASPTVKAVTPATASAVFAAANPGDVLDLAAGSYGGFTFVRDGTPGAPIVIRSTAGAVINGDVALFSRAYVHITGLTVNGRIRFNGSRHIAITRNTVNSVAPSYDGIVGYSRPENAYIADNTVVGTTVWAESSLGVSGDNRGEGIVVSGPGHVIQNNRVTGFRDNISLYESADNAEAQQMEQVSIDILNNDLSLAADDAIEADFCLHNCRVMRNRITNAFVALSSQPSLGGPAYFVRNVIYNAVYVPFKLYRNSHGDVLLHNTVVKNGDAFGAYPGSDRPIARLFGRNNLFVGGPGGTYGGYGNGAGRVLAITDLQTTTVDLDYDGYGVTTGGFDVRWGTSSFATLAQMQAATTEQHARQVGLAVFQASVAYPGSPMTTYAVPDLRLKSGGAAVDGGQAIPNVNDGYAGSAPDLGAYEQGAALPVYGPR